MLDLSNMPTTAALRLTKAVPRREGASLSWDVDLSMEVPDEDAAEVVEGYVPGCVAAYAAREGAKGTTKTAGGFDLVKVVFRDAEGEDLASGHAEVRSAQVATNASQAVLTLRLRVHGLLLPAAMEVVKMLDEQVEVELRAHSTQLSLLPGDGEPPPSLDGKLIVHQLASGEVVAGIVAEQDGRKLRIATMEATELVDVQLDSSSPDTVLDVRAPKGEDMREALVAYIARCDKAHVTASWNDVVTALGELYASHEASAGPDFAWELDAKVWDAAFKAAQEARGVVAS